jgi:hypothetical protein
MGWWPAEERSIMESLLKAKNRLNADKSSLIFRELAVVAVLKARKPSSSGPLCFIADKARLKSGSGCGESGRIKSPARPHMGKY